MKYSKLFIIISATLGMFLAVSTYVKAQERQSEGLTEELQAIFKNEALHVSTMLMPRAAFLFDNNAGPGARGFSVPFARVKAKGNLSEGFGYVLHVDAANDRILLDALMKYTFSPKATISAGSMLPGLSGELMTSPDKIDFYTRSLPVTALLQNREIGVQLSGTFNSHVDYSVGIFNGNRLAINTDNEFYYTAHVGYKQEIGETGQFRAGINGGYGTSENLVLGSGLLPAVRGERFIYGGDFRYESEKWIAAGEILAAQLNYKTFAVSDNILSYQLTGGYRFTPKTRAMIRYEQLSSDEMPSVITWERVMLGLNHYPTSQTGIRLNYVIPVEDLDFKNHGLVATWHVAF